MRKAIDLFLTINLFGIIVLGAYMWFKGTLIIEFRDSQTAAVVEQNVVLAFTNTLHSEVDRIYGVPDNGYEPYMFMHTFPGLAPTDFEGVEASIGHYLVEDGLLQHKIPSSALRHDAAKAITTRGMEVLLDNVATRLR